MKTLSAQRFSREKLRATRTRLNLTQGQLAQLIGYTRDTVNGYETGRLTPRPIVVSALARALKVTESSLIDQDGPE